MQIAGRRWFRFQPKNPVRLQTASRTLLMSRPLSVRPTPSSTDVATLVPFSLAKYSCGGTHPPSSSSSSRPSHPTGPSGSTRRKLGQTGTSIGAEAATVRRGAHPSSRARESPPPGRSTQGRAGRGAISVRRQPVSSWPPPSVEDQKTSYSARSGRSVPAPWTGGASTLPRRRSALSIACD
ncbi:unnamed protein product, partial [Musa hybrid cultivar]